MHCWHVALHGLHSKVLAGRRGLESSITKVLPCGAVCLQRPNMNSGVPMQTSIVNSELDCRAILRERAAVGMVEQT